MRSPDHRLKRRGTSLFVGLLLGLQLFLAGAPGPEVATAQTPSLLRRTQTATPADTGQASSPALGIQLDNKAIRQGVNTVQMRYQELLDREESALSKKTIQNLRTDILQVFQGKNPAIRELSNTFTTYFSSWTHVLNLAVALIIIGILVFSYRPIKKYLRSLREDWARRDLLAITTLGYLLEIFLRVLPTLLFMLGIWGVAVVLALPKSFIGTLFRIGGAIVLFKFLRWFLEIAFAPDEQRHRIIPCGTRVAKYFFYFSRVLLQWGLLYALLLFVVQFLRYSANVQYLISFGFRLGALVIFAFLFARRDFTMTLFPETKNKLYSTLLGIFNRLYYPAYGILILAGLLSVLGYFKLSGFIFTRVFYTIVIILLGILVNRILYDVLDWLIPAEKRQKKDEDDKSAPTWDRIYTLGQFVISGGLILLSAVLLAKAWWLLGKQSIGQSILSIFHFPLFTIQTTPITPWSFLKALLIFALFIYISKYLRRFLKSSVLQKTKLDIGARHAILTVTHYIILVVGIVVAMESVGIQLTTLKVFAGALGLGIGFGLQNIANNFASGLIILFERPIKSKDFVQVGEILGTVTRISARSTTILTRDNIAIIVPNSDFIEKTVVNWSLENTPTRVHVPIGVEYGTDPEVVKEILLDIADDHPRVLSYPKPRIWFREFGDSSLNFELLVWINDPQQGVNNIKSDINFRIAQAFKDKSIGIPFPQRDLHFKLDGPQIDILRRILHRGGAEGEESASEETSPDTEEH